jgi:flavin reductase (DIM6/NTAB) family NADH-FMN oxidoreductase RutF
MPDREVAEEAKHRSAFLNQMRRVPGSVAIVATGAGEERTGLAATAWNSLCADPPMLLACINRRASAHAVIHRTGAFSINLLPADHQETVAIFSAQRGLEGSARFLDDVWVEGDRGQPMLREAIASFECALEGTHDYGTHTILIGRVGTMHCRDDVEAMLYLDGGFASAIRAT